jgi:hypothetical protein
VGQPDDSLEILIRMTADTSGGKEAIKAIDDVGKQTGKTSEATAESGRHAEKSGLSHRALHMILRQVGESSRGLEIGLAALSGVMMGSVTFGITAVIQGVRLLIEHFEKQKEKVKEVAKATVEAWTTILQANADARKAASDYATALEKIFTNVNTLKEKEGEEQAVLQKILEARLKILEAERQAEIAKAKGDKEEEARINARYGRRNTDAELQNEQAEIDLKKAHLDDQTRDAMQKQRALETAEKAKEAGAPGRTEAAEAAATLPKLREELDTLRAKMDTAALTPQQRDEAQGKIDEYNALGAAGRTFAGANQSPVYLKAMAALRQFSKERETAEAYSGAQQEFEQRQADIEQFTTGTEKLNKAVEEATQGFSKAVEAMRATEGEMSKAQAVHGVNVDAAKTIQQVKDRGGIEGAGGKYGSASQKVLDEVRAMAGTGEGRAMSGQDVSYFNNLLASSRAQGKEASMRAVIEELRDLHTDESKKWADLSEAIKEMRSHATGQGQVLVPDAAYFKNLLAEARGQGREGMMQGVIKELRDFHVDESKKWQDLWAAIRELRAQRRDASNQ